jgi:hypothetical protein
MGQRHAVAVAQCATDVLTGFALPRGVSVQTCIDNVRIVGPKAGVRAAAIQLVRRCRIADITINELPSYTSMEDDAQRIAGLIGQEGDWLGAFYDYQRGVQRVAQKTIDKINTSWAARDNWTHRRYAAHMGLLFFAASVLRTKVASYFDALKHLRARSQQLTWSPELWDARVALALAETKALERWTEECTSNKFVPCLSGTPPAHFLVTDASDWGWGALYFDQETGAAHSCSVAWTETERATLHTEHSTRAEPEAVYRAICRFVRPSDRRTLAVITDSSTARYALQKGYSPSFEVNAVAGRLYAAFPFTQFAFHHVAGKANEADPLSRADTRPIAASEVKEMALRCVRAAGAKAESH